MIASLCTGALSGLANCISKGSDNTEGKICFLPLLVWV